MQENISTTTNAPILTCPVCGCEHEDTEVPDTSSLQLCSSCFIAERRIRPLSFAGAFRRR